MKMHSKREWEAKHGRRISKGAWERLNRLYEVHICKGKARIVGYDDTGNPLFGPVCSMVLARETVKCNRKVSMTDRYLPKESTRTRYLGEPAGLTR